MILSKFLILLTFLNSHQEEDFFAFYMDRSRCPISTDFMLPSISSQGVTMRIRIHRYKELFRSIKKLFSPLVFISSQMYNFLRAFQRDKLRSEITTLHLCSVYDFDTKSAQSLLTQIKSLRSTLPKIERLVLELRMLECYVNLGNEKKNFKFPLNCF